MLLTAARHRNPAIGNGVPGDEQVPGLDLAYVPSGGDVRVEGIVVRRRVLHDVLIVAVVAAE